MTDPGADANDPKRSLQLFVFLDGFLRLFIWSSSIALTLALFTACEAWPADPVIGADLRTAWLWGNKLTHLVLLFNLIYIAHLIVFRLIFPTPKEGRYEIGPGKKLSRQLIYACALGMLTKARYEAPFPGFLVFHLCNLPPMRWFMNTIFGPKSRSCFITEPVIADPHLTSIGRNVVIGFGTTIAAHFQDSGTVVIKRTVIEDDVLIGAHAALSGVHVKRGAAIAAGSIVLPGSVIGENEYWSGNPARRRKVLPPVGQRGRGRDKNEE